MRALALATLTMMSCTNVRECKSGTLLIHVTLDGDSAQADQLAVTVNIDGTPYVNPAQPHTPGASRGDLEVDFPSGYPHGSQAVVEVVALLGNAELGRQSTLSIPLAAGCTSTSLAVSSTSGDLALPPPVTSDLAGVPI